MLVIVGIIIVFGSLITGYMMHGGQLKALAQINEFIIIGGAALGALLIMVPMPTVKKIIKGLTQIFKGARVSKQSYVELLQLMYELFQFAKREGLIALEPHVERPDQSAIMSKYPSFLANNQALEFFCDTLKVILSGGVPAHDLEELMDIDLESIHFEERVPPGIVITIADSFPGLGIVAAVLGVVITMQSITAGPAKVGENVAAALVGTFLGVLLCYGLVGPIGKNMEGIMQREERYLQCIKAALLAFAKGTPASIAIEYGRRSIDPENRPSFQETEDAMRRTR